ncbi:MAG TPA: ATP-binding protein [Oceanipulchritudo sp.]|nr:ATP-binding protein [Oceanipulchritudo sp.]
MKSILIVEDDPDHQELIDASLRGHAKHAFEWVFSSRLSQAAELLCKRKFDLILLDLSLPDSAFNETLGRMLEFARGLPVIVLTSLDDRRTIMGMIHQGAHDCIPKSMLNSIMLERAITYCLDREEIQRENLEKERRLVYESGFRKLVENNRIGIAITSPDGRIFEANHAAMTFLGIDTGGPTEARIQDFLPPEAAAKLDEALRTLESSETEESMLDLDFLSGTGKSFSGELVIQSANWLNHGPSLIFSIHDLTRRKEAEAGLMSALERVEKESQAKSDLISMLSHDIRTPLCSIISVVEYLNLVGLDETSDGYLESIDQLARSVLNLIDNILVDARSDPQSIRLNKDFCRVDKLVESLTDLYRVQADKKSVRILTDVTLDREEHYLDQGKLQQILNNLISNALKFTPENGTICLSAESRDDWLHFVVKDSGIGISLEDQARLFQPFTQANESVQRKYGGTGLGLSICRKLCQRMGGSISLESEPEQGAAFTVSLPCPDPDVKPPEEA